jgi:hypothetical protein
VSTGGISVPVDAGLEAFSQDEFLVGVERTVGPGLTVGVKGTYRSLNNVIAMRGDLDDTSPLNDYGSFAVINPGSNGDFARGAAPICNSLDEPHLVCSSTGPAIPLARRLYRGIEILARKSVGDRLWLQASYIYSSLRGNFDGGVNEGAIGETSPGVTTTFYFPGMWQSNSYGALALDRTHRLRLDGYWRTPWRISIGLQAFLESGAPYNKLGYLNNIVGPAAYLEPRGSAGRMPTLWEANLQLAYPVAIGPVTVTLQAYLFNAFNNQTATTVDEVWSWDPPAGYPATINDPDQAQGNPTYGQVTWRYPPRSFRAGMRVSF